MSSVIRGSDNFDSAQAVPVLMTAWTYTSGTPGSVDFTGIPSWAKRITVMFSGVSTTGTNAFLIQLGISGGIENTGYSATSSRISTTVVTQGSTAGFPLVGGGLTGTTTYSAYYLISKIDGNTWCLQGGMSDTAATQTHVSFGSKSLSGVLDRVRITTTTGADTFDAGTINVMYE